MSQVHQEPYRVARSKAIPSPSFLRVCVDNRRLLGLEVGVKMTHRADSMDLLFSMSGYGNHLRKLNQSHDEGGVDCLPRLAIFEEIAKAIPQLAALGL
jgi:hypothetical protein